MEWSDNMHRNEYFLLDSQLAKNLYLHVKDLPIIDFYTKFSAKQLLKNEPIQNISSFWLNDPYKWRLMRNSGFFEYEITGEDDEEHKFKVFAATIERAYLNPIHHWTHLELRRYFRIEDFITKDGADELYKKITNELSNNPKHPLDMLIESGVEHVFVEEDHCDDLEAYKLLKDETDKIHVHPIFCPDSILDVNSDDFLKRIELLQKVSSTTISGMTTLATALSKRLDYFNVNGCTVASHNISELRYISVTKEEASKILKKRMMDYKLSSIEEHKLRLYLLKFFLKEYAIRDMVCQIHIGILPSHYKKSEGKKGQGHETISTHSFVDELHHILGELYSHYPLPKMILYHLNRSDNEAVASLCGNFSQEEPGKLQYGGAFWLNIHEQGVVEQIKTYAHHLNLSTYIGQPSHGHIVPSIVRHDYFRRILANTIANEVLKGRIPEDQQRLLSLMEDLVYLNRKRYFRL
jgi:glucuronate isomerase